MVPNILAMMYTARDIFYQKIIPAIQAVKYSKSAVMVLSIKNMMLSLPLYGDYSPQSDILAMMAPAERYFVLDGPFCVDDEQWWQVEYRGYVGYVPNEFLWQALYELTSTE